jgi:hypothetical protein
MKFLILMAVTEGDWDALSRAEQESVFRQHEAYHAALEREGRLVSSGRLAPAAEARTVTRRRDGKLVVRDGPFAETKEVVGGYYVIEAESLADAVEWAERGRFIAGSNEVRAILE